MTGSMKIDLEFHVTKKRPCDSASEIVASVSMAKDK